jgi:hypothetical protein
MGWSINTVIRRFYGARFENEVEMTDVRTRGALVASLLVGAFLLLQNVIGNVVSVVYSFTQGQGGAGSPFAYSTLDFFVRIIPVVIGVFLVFWRLAPIMGGLVLRSVILRALVAAAAGALLSLIVGTIFGFAQSFTGYLFGNSFPYGNVADAFGAVVGNVTSAVTGFVGLVPLVALAAVLLWLWLRGKAATR